MSHGFECSLEMILTKVKGKGIAEVRRQYIYWVMRESLSKLYNNNEKSKDKHAQWL